MKLKFIALIAALALIPLLVRGQGTLANSSFIYTSNQTNRYDIFNNISGIVSFSAVTPGDGLGKAIFYGMSTNGPVYTNIFLDPPVTGFTNVGGGAASSMTTNTYYTNTFGTKLTAYIYCTNGAAISELGLFAFTSSGAAWISATAPSVAQGFASATTQTNTMQLTLGPGEYFALTNLAGGANVVTNKVRLWQ